MADGLRITPIHVHQAVHGYDDGHRLLVSSIPLNGLDEQPEKKVLIVVAPGFEAERSVLAIWEQQWPRLKRSFRFCTLAYADRSFQGASFDLQVLPPEERSQRVWAKVAGYLVDAR